MRLLLLVEWYHPIGGIEAFTWRLAKHLNPNIQITIAVCFVGQKTELASPANNIKIVDVSAGTVSAVQRLVTEFKPTVIHSNHLSLIGFAGYRASRTQQIPFVVTNHQVPEYRVRGWQRFLNRFVWAYVRLLDGFAAAITAPSPTVAQFLENHGVTEKVATISCGVDTNLFHPRPKQEARRQVGIMDKPTLLFVGRIAKDKNIELLLRAAANLKKDHDFQVVVVGPKAVKNDASQEVAGLITQLNLQNTVAMAGFIPPDSELLARYYAASDIFVIPSFFETQSIVTLEAMASGRPIVGSNSGALPDLVTHGANGLLFTPLNADDLTTQLRTLLANPAIANAMGTESRKKVALHSIERVAPQYEALYTSLSQRSLAPTQQGKTTTEVTTREKES